jgi:hypothetical protein
MTTGIPFAYSGCSDTEKEYAMSTITLVYPNVSRDRRTPAIGLIAILVVTSLALIAGAILVIVLSPNRDAYQADLIPVVRSSPDSLPIAVPVPTPSTEELQPSASETPAPFSGVVSASLVVPVPVPTPPSS